MVATHTVTGNIRKGSGGASGRVAFWPSEPVKHTADSLYLSQAELEVDLEDGQFSVQLYATDDPGWSPADWEWVCALRVIDGSTEKFTFSLTGDADLTDLLPSEAPA